MGYPCDTVGCTDFSSFKHWREIAGTMDAEGWSNDVVKLCRTCEIFRPAPIGSGNVETLTQAGFTGRTLRIPTHGSLDVLVPLNGSRVFREWSDSTEEGYSAGSEEWWIEDGAVHHVATSDGRDCDGRTSSYRHLAASLNSGLTSMAWNDYNARAVVDWAEVDSASRDYSAETAGY